MDETAPARCDSLYAAEEFAAAAGCAQSLLAAVDARGAGASPTAARLLSLAVRAHIQRGGRLEPIAAEYADRLLALFRSLHGPESTETAAALVLKGQILERTGQYAAARAVFEEALAIRAATGLPDDIDLANCLVALANVRARLGDYDGLPALYDRALAITEVASGPMSATAARILVNHAILKKLTGDLAGAGALYERSLAIQRDLYGENHPSVARTHFNLANLSIETGDCGAARAGYLASLRIREAILGHESPEVAQTLIGLALTEHRAADFLSARAYAERALAIQQRHLPAQHPKIADALAVLALIQLDLGDFVPARDSFNQVLAIYGNAYGPTHPRVGEILVQLGRLGYVVGDLDGARATYDRARGIYEALDDGGRRLAQILTSEAALLAEMGLAGEACALAARAVAIREQVLGPAHAAMGVSLAILGRCLRQVGENAEAERALRRSLEVLESTRGDDHPFYLHAQYDLARTLHARGAASEALSFALVAEHRRLDNVRLTLRGLPERLALLYANRWPRGLDLAVAIACAGDLETDAAARAWSALIRSRALVLDEMALRHRASSLTGEAAADSLRRALAEATRESAGLLIKGWQADEEPETVARSRILHARREMIEQQLGMLGEHAEMTVSSGQPTFAEISATLPDDAALIGYVRFDRAPRPSADDTPARSGKDTQPAYAAFVLPVDRRNPVAVDLGSADEIDRLVRTWRDEAGLGRNVVGRSASAAAEAYRRAGAALRARIWDPLADHLASAGRIYVVPDGPLHLVSLAALPDDGERYLIDADRPLIYLTTERDLVDRLSIRPVAGSLLALGAPDFTDCLASVDLEPLPASAEEVAAIAALWRRSRPGASQDGAVLPLFGRDASEAAFKRLAPRYRALHVATHGFYWAEDLTNPLAALPGRGASPGQSGQRGIGGLLAADPPVRGLDREAKLNPMLRSGLLLAGDPDRPLGSADGGEDGVLTAAEISVLDLRGVDWVVLSACETGVGMTQASEGVFGLRRAFRIAGARGLVISLWPLADDLARDWMLQLYAAHLTDRLDLVPAAWQASKAVLAARRTAGLDTHPHTWAGFITCGD